MYPNSSDIICWFEPDFFSWALWFWFLTSIIFLSRPVPQTGITFFALQRFRLGQAGLGSGEGAGVDPSMAPGADTSGISPSGYAGIPDQPQQQQLYGGDTNPTSGGAPGSYYTPTY